jgi:hypothetical protein
MRFVSARLQLTKKSWQEELGTLLAICEKTKQE